MTLTAVRQRGGSALINKAYIQPTGDEIMNGVVLDTDSPMIQKKLAHIGFEADIAKPIADDQKTIEQAICGAADSGYRIAVLIGGSGGGHYYDAALNFDLTHSAMDHMLSEYRATSLYGKNGHLWCRLVCGFLNGTLFFNVPGPYQEASAAIDAFCKLYDCGNPDYNALNQAMAEAVRATYGQ